MNWRLLFLLFLASVSFARADEKILFLGDSHAVGFFGQALVDTLPNLIRYAISGATAEDWTKEKICAAGSNCPFIYGYTDANKNYLTPIPVDFPGIDTLLRKVKPKTIIVALGTNDARRHCHQNAPEAFRGIRDLVHKLSGRHCIWIGPPLYSAGPIQKDCQERYNWFVSGLRRTVESAHCHFIESRYIKDPETHIIIAPNTSDKIHFSDRVSRVWATFAAKKIRKASHRSPAPVDADK